jgi:hypothetical protein
MGFLRVLRWVAVVVAVNVALNIVLSRVLGWPILAIVL